MLLAYQMSDVFNYLILTSSLLFYSKAVFFDGSQFCAEMMSFLGAGNNSAVGMTVSVTVTVEEFVRG